MKIAVIGSGIAGLTSAYLLASEHDVTVIEKSDRIGGHAHTLHIDEASQSIAVDNGFMVYNPAMYPNFVELLHRLKVSTTSTTMSFGVDIPGKVQFRGDVPGGLFAQKSNIFSKRYILFLLEVVRFRRLAKRALREGCDPYITLDDFLTTHSLSVDLANWFLYPMLAAIWSMHEAHKVKDFPAHSTFTFLNNHQLLNSAQPTWRTIVGGSEMYVTKLRSYLEKKGVTILLNTNVTKVARSDSNVRLTISGKVNTFDYVLFATHADVTHKLLTDKVPEEKTALEFFSYSTNKTVLHKDLRVLPKNAKLHSSWNYTIRKKKTAVFTYCMNILQHIPKVTPVLVTLNPHMKLHAKDTYHVEQYSHPQYSVRSLEGQRRIAELQGLRRTLYAGAHLGYGFHEDGVVSAIRAVSVLGVVPPWQNKG